MFLASACVPPLILGQEIPDRPEKLSFAPLKYEPPNAADYRVILKSGPVAYIVPDHELPLVNFQILVRTGDYTVPQGKEGLADLTGYLLAHGGTESMTAQQMEERLAFLAAQLSTGVGETSGNVNLNLLSKDLDEGMTILRQVLTAPRFQEDQISLRKEQILQSMRQRNDESAAIEGRERGFLAYGENFWANRYSTSNSIAGITREDMQQFHRAWFVPSNFVVAVNGDFDRAKMIEKLEALFANWPFAGQTPPAIPTNTQFATPGIYIVDKDVNQGRVDMMLPGIKRDNPDYFSIQVMNRILGGGGFTSRIMNRVRSDEGLAYSAGSSFQGGVYYPGSFTAFFQSKLRTVTYAVSIILDEVKKFNESPVTDSELHTAKRSYIDSFPRTFATKGQIASIFAQDEFTGRYAADPDYWKNYRGNIGKVTEADVQRVAKEWLLPERFVILVIGGKADILKGYPGHDVQLNSLSPGKVTDVPLRDPMTMQLK
jgi:predicted Zn-dependent peptidase